MLDASPQSTRSHVGLAPNGLVPARLLDADRDGRLSVADAQSFERQALAASPADRGALAFAAQQARVGAALLPGAPVAAPQATVATALPGLTPGSSAPADLRRSIESLDLSSLRTTGARLVSTFDFDSTIASGEVLAPVMARLGQRGLLDSKDTSFRSVMDRYGIAIRDAAAPPDANRDAQAVMQAIMDAGKGADRDFVTAAFFASTSALRGVPVAEHSLLPGMSSSTEPRSSASPRSATA